MNSSQWNLFKSILKGENEKIYTGLIVDSPWMPGYCGVSTLDFYTIPDVWLSCYAKIKRDFPDVLFLPGYWVEYGMTAEPSGFGAKLSFYDGNLPSVHPLADDVEDMEDIINALKQPDPRKDGVMPLLLNIQRYLKPKLADTGEEIKIVSTRGPMTVAAHLFSVTELLLCAKIEPDVYHKLLKITTKLCKDWLDAQLEAAGTAEGILVLDDITGFFSKNDYLEFAHPYLKEIFSSYPEMIKLLHNDTANDVPYPYMPDLGIDLFNFTHERNIGTVREQISSDITLLGNVPPMSLAKNTPEEVYELTKGCISDYIAAAGNLKRLLLSVGGGVPMGAKGECIKAMIEAVQGLT